MVDTTIIIPKSRRQLRERKQRKLYAEEYPLGDDDTEGIRKFSVAEKLESLRFAQAGMVRELTGNELTIGYLQQYGFNIPLLFKEKSGLGLRVPSTNFSVNDVRTCVGSKRILDVMDVNTQKNLKMTMKEWQSYYDDPVKTRLLNVISLEFSHTKLDNYIQSPAIVRNIDWVDVVWPKQLKDAQIEGTNSIDTMMYPKVQKYCLMSVQNCYTDFHVDFGGTSVWYHILKGSKVFWLIPPTEKNLQLYEQWVLSGKQSDIFFGDAVEKCARIYLTAGNTFFIPTGWIHAVYTPVDSLVFGGNFLHSFGILKQLKIAQVEDNTKVPQKFRYPFFTEMLWYVLAKYVYTLLGRAHLEGEPNREAELESIEHVHLTHYELFGLKEIVMFLYDLPQQKKNVPDLVKDPVALIKDVRTLVERHCKDSTDLAVTGRPILIPELNQSFNIDMSMSIDPEQSEIVDSENGCEDLVNVSDPVDSQFVSPQNVTGGRTGPRGPYKKHTASPNGVPTDRLNSSGNPPRRRRTRCKHCEACQRSDCGECSFCLDMVKFGGPGRAKQTCMMRQCLQPMLPVTAQCVFCNLDGWGQVPQTPPNKLQATIDGPSSLMECSVCYEIAHTDCAHQSVHEEPATVSGLVNEDLPNSWECPSCCLSGKNNDYKPRHFRARLKSSEIRRMSVSSDATQKDQKPMPFDPNGSSGSEVENGGSKILSETLIKDEIKQENDKSSISNSTIDPNVTVKRRKSDDGSPIMKTATITDGMDGPVDISVMNMPRKKNTLRTQLGNQILNSSTKQLKKPTYVVRPNHSSLHQQQPPINHLALDPTCLLAIFRHLTPEMLVTCSTVCKIWSNVSVHPLLWKRMNCGHHKLTACLLIAIVRRQPEHLILDWTSLAKMQLAWLIARLPALKILSLQGTPITAILGLHTCMCPPIQELDLSFVRGLNDSAIRDILSPPKDSSPGLTDSKSRLRNLRKLKVAGTDITDVALRYITQGIPSLTHLDVSSCQRITDAGVAQIGTCSSAINILIELDLSGCKLVTESCLEYLSKCEALTYLDLRHVPHVSTQAVIKFAAKSKHNLQVRDIKLVDKRRGSN